LLAWSYILDYENSANPFGFRKTSIIEWKKRAFTFVEESENVLKQAKVVKKHGLKAKDALHIACAIEAGCDYFITTDDEILDKGSSISQIAILNPVEMITILEK